MLVELSGGRFESLKLAASLEKRQQNGDFEGCIQQRCVESTSEIIILRYLHCKGKNSVRCVVSDAWLSRNTIEPLRGEHYGSEREQRRVRASTR